MIKTLITIKNLWTAYFNPDECSEILYEVKCSKSHCKDEDELLSILQMAETYALINYDDIYLENEQQFKHYRKQYDDYFDDMYLHAYSSYTAEDLFLHYLDLRKVKYKKLNIPYCFKW